MLNANELFCDMLDNFYCIIDDFYDGDVKPRHICTLLDDIEYSVDTIEDEDYNNSENTEEEDYEDCYDEEDEFNEEFVCDSFKSMNAFDRARWLVIQRGI